MTSVTVNSLARSIYSVSSETLNEVGDDVVVEGNGVVLESDSDSTVIGKNYTVDDLYLEEPPNEYCVGGYHRGYIGEAIGPDDRYVLLRKLGWGGYCTVWLANDRRNDRYVAIKIHKSRTEYSYAARKELKVLRRIQSVAKDSSHAGCSHVVELLDAFSHLGPHGLHVCLVFEPLNESLLSLQGQFHRGGKCYLKELGTTCVKDGLPLELAKEVTRQVLLALDFLHKECGIVHSDIKPENVMLEFPELPNKWEVVRFLHEYSLQEQKRSGRDSTKSTVSNPLPSPFFQAFTDDVKGFSKPDFSQVCGKDWKSFFKVKVVDFGNACPLSNKTQGYNVQTFEYRAPEIFLQYPGWGYAADIWSVACLFSEMCTARYLFRTNDSWLQVSSQLELFSATLGPATGSFLDKCFLFKDYHDCVKNCQFRSISENLRKELGVERVLAQKIEQFMVPMLRWDPAERADAMTCANHPFLCNGKLIHVGKLRGTIAKPLSMKPPLAKSLKKILRTGSLSF